jgi:hypothetical protein
MKLADPYTWSSDVVFPDPIPDQINRLLTLASTCHRDGIDMSTTFVGIKADGDVICLDAEHCPPALLPSWVMMNADTHDFIVLLSCYEGYTVPPEVAERWAKEGRPAGQIKDQPESYETLMLGVETQKGTWIGQSKIVGESPNCIVKEVIALHKAEVSFGRFNNLLKCNWTNDLGGTLRKALEAKQFVDKSKQ